MSDYTENYNLKKPKQTESYNVDEANSNNDIIDKTLFEKQDKETGKGLSTNDFTNLYKKKLDLLFNYDDTSIKKEIESLDERKVDVKDFEKLAEENEFLRENQLYGKTSGRNINLQDSAKAHVNLKLKGSTNQATRSGKNLLNVTATSRTYSEGITITVNKDKSITISGTNTSTKTMFCRLADDFVLSAGDYTLSNKNSSVNNNSGFIFYDDGNNFPRTNISNATFTKDTTIKPYLKVNAGVTVNNQTVYPMIIKGTYTEETLPPYEQYGASPSPDYPSPIENVEGKNKFDINQEKEIFGIMLYKYSYYLKPNTKYTISSNCPASTTANIYANSNSSNSAVYINKNQTIQSDENGYFYILVRFKADASDNSTFNLYEKILNGTYYIQLEEGTVATPYKPYNSLEIKDVGKNLLKNSSLTENLEDWDVVRTDNTTLSISEIFNKKCLHIKGGLNKGQYIRQPIQNRIQVGNKYTISCKAYLKDFVSGTTNPICAFYLDGVGIDGKWIGPSYSGGQNFSDTKYNYSQGFIEVKTTITINKNTDLTKTFAMFVYARDFTGDLYIYDLQLEEGTTATPYKPYQEQKLDFPLSEGQKLYEGSYLASDGIHHKRKQIVLKGTENWAGYAEKTNTVSVYLIMSDLVETQNSNILSNRFQKVGYEQDIEGIVTTPYVTKLITIKINKSRLTESSLVGIKNWLETQYSNGTPVIVEYELATEEIVPYIEAQQEAWDKIEQLHTYKNVTNIFSDTELDIVYVRDLQTVINNLLNKIDEQKG